MTRADAGGSICLREHEPLDREKSGLSEADWKSLEAFARKNQKDKQGAYRPVLEFGRREKTLRATNYVGILSTRSGRPIEILPKIDLASDTDDADWTETRRVFLQMLRVCRQLKHAELPPSSIRSLERFPMLEAFVHLFLQNLARVTRYGLARTYVPVESNLPYLRGRLLFQEQIRQNLSNQTRFFVAHDEFGANRPANRLIRATLDRLRSVVRTEDNRRLLREMTEAFEEVPPTKDRRGDWRRHSVDRSMQHYRPVMAWVRLFLFREGLVTWHGKHENQSLLFPMEKVYEDFVTSSFRRYQSEYRVKAQGPKQYLTCDPRAFQMKPDITLHQGSRCRFILDAKWKRLAPADKDPRTRDIAQADMYQLYAYAKRYDCPTVALIYPRKTGFDKPLRFVFHDHAKLLCLPFDVSRPEHSVHCCLAALDDPDCPKAWLAQDAN